MTRRVLFAAAGAALIATLGTTPAFAEESPTATIESVTSQHGIEKVLVSFRGLSAATAPDLSSVQVQVEGTSHPAKATPVSQDQSIDRTTVLVLDCSNSMAGERFEAAKAAALTFIEQAPADVKIGLVTFATTAQTVQAPTTDRGALRSAIEGLALTKQTHLYDGLLTAVDAAGSQGRRSLLVLTDGVDTTDVGLGQVTNAVQASGVSVDAVALSVSDAGAAALSQVTKAGNGVLVNAEEPGALDRLFRAEAQVLSDQVLVSFPVPAASAGTNANLTVSMAIGDTTYSDSAYVAFGELPVDPRASEPIPVAPSQAPDRTAYAVVGIGAIAVALLVGVAILLGAFERRESTDMSTLLDGYGATRASQPGPVVQDHASNVRQSAVGIASKAIGQTRFDDKIAHKLEVAGLALKPGEWVLLHAGIALASGILGLLLMSGSMAFAVLFMLVGAVCPWVYLGMRASKRVRAFNSQLPDALQLIAGGLQAGLSLAQAVDTIVREGTNPIAAEFRRALVEHQLGSDLEDALEGVAVRMQSQDFAWIVMAVRTQRQVGGNLGEILLTVTATLRDREHLRRHVRALSAEGRLSAWILGLMPVLFLGYLALTNKEMVSILFTTAIGVVLLVVATVLMAVGAFWLSRVVKVEA